MLIEKDEVRPVSGIRFGKSLGSPITFIIENRDFKNWVKKMSAIPGDRGAAEVVTRARPGHADLAGGAEIQSRRYSATCSNGRRRANHCARCYWRPGEADSCAVRKST